MTTALDRARAMHEQVIQLHMDMSDELYGLLKTLQKRQTHVKELTDIGYYMREISKLLDETRKNAKARSELAGKLIALHVTQQSLNDLSLDTTTRGEVSTASVDVCMQARLPKKGSPAYIQLCRHFGLPEKAIEAGLFKLDWNMVSAYVTHLAEEGIDPPEGLTDQYANHKVVFRRRTRKES